MEVQSLADAIQVMCDPDQTSDAMVQAFAACAPLLGPLDRTLDLLRLVAAGSGSSGAPVMVTTLREQHDAVVIQPAQRLRACRVIAAIISNGYASPPEKRSREVLMRLLQTDLPRERMYGAQEQLRRLLEEADAEAQLARGWLVPGVAAPEQAASAAVTARGVVRVYLYNRAFVTLAVADGTTANEFLELLRPKLAAKSYPVERLGLYAVVNDVERLLDGDASVTAVLQQWQAAGAAVNDTHLLSCHDPQHPHVPFSSPLPIEKEGYLMKKGGKSDGGRGAGRWQRRFFRLRGTELSYFANREAKEPRGAIELQGARVLCAAAATGRRHAVEVATVDRAYFFQFESAGDMDAWLAAFADKVASIDFGNAREGIDCEGFVDKRNNYNTWQQRWFALRGTDLAYYGEPSEINTPGKGHIDLSRATLQRGSERPLSVDIVTPLRTYVMATDRPGDLMKWLKALSAVAQCGVDLEAWLRELQMEQGWTARARSASVAHTGDADAPPLDDGVAPSHLALEEEVGVLEKAFENASPAATAERLVEFERLRFLRLRTRDFVRHAAGDTDTGVAEMLWHAEVVAQWAQRATAASVPPSERRAALVYFGAVLRRLLSLRSYNTLYALVPVLQTALSQGDETEDLVGVKTSLIRVGALLAPRDDYAKYRERLRSDVHGAIPAFQLVTRDLSALQAAVRPAEGRVQLDQCERFVQYVEQVLEAQRSVPASAA